MSQLRASRRLVVISDLHLGGDAPCMMSHPARLATFIRSIRDSEPGDALELVIAGDFVDYLSVVLPGEASAPWTPDPKKAVAKLEAVMGGSFGVVFDALGENVARGHRLTILLGNHDVELALPPVKDALLSRLGASRHEVLFIDDGLAYRMGGVLVEHGNRYDDANQNDLTHLRAIASALSRGEAAPKDELEVSAGSLLVDKVVNPLKKHYTFVDLLKPEGELLVLLLLAFEPTLVRSVLGQIGRVFEAQRLAQRNADGRPPGQTQNVGASVAPEDEELGRLFGEDFASLRHPAQNVGFTDWVRLVVDALSADSLKVLFEKGRPVPVARLERIRAVMRGILSKDRTFERGHDDPKDGLLNAAKRMLRGDVEVVVMGHTHLARSIDIGAKKYINTGTWADLVTVPKGVLDDGKDAEFVSFLKSLCDDAAREQIFTYADIRLDERGRVVKALLQDASS